MGNLGAAGLWGAGARVDRRLNGGWGSAIFRSGADSKPALSVRRALLLIGTAFRDTLIRGSISSPGPPVRCNGGICDRIFSDCYRHLGMPLCQLGELFAKDGVFHRSRPFQIYRGPLSPIDNLPVGRLPRHIHHGTSPAIQPDDSAGRGDIVRVGIYLGRYSARGGNAGIEPSAACRRIFEIRIDQAREEKAHDDGEAESRVGLAFSDRFDEPIRHQVRQIEDEFVSLDRIELVFITFDAAFEAALVQSASTPCQFPQSSPPKFSQAPPR